VHAANICLTPRSVYHLSPPNIALSESFAPGYPKELHSTLSCGTCLGRAVPALYLVLRLSGGAAAPALKRSNSVAVSGGYGEAQEDTLARRLRKKLLLEFISAH